MDIVTKNLTIVRNCIENKSYEELETDRFEFKDLSRGWGRDFQKTICAFLNGNGGVMIIGISDKNNAKPPYYTFTGYINSSENENYLIQKLPKLFTDREGKIMDVSAHITLEIRDFLEGRLAVLYVEELNSESKYAFYEGIAYKRILTGDHPMSPSEIETYEEIKRDVVKNRELTIVEGTSVDNVDLEVLNNFIYEYNRGKKRGESFKKSREEALVFLHHQYFMRENQLTILGMLVCGSEPQYFIQGKCECDCYVIIPKAPQVAQNKEVIEDNIIELIRKSQNFVWRSIQVGIGFTNGGIALPEYPESLIRECINNAFAHRSYIDDRFVIIEIRPQESLVIRNPGLFEQRQRIYQDSSMGKIRRIIPLQVARNPKLTHLLKSFDYWEGRGKGLTSLIDACLDNEIDVPYYVLSQEEIKLCIPKGKVNDESISTWIDSFLGYIKDKTKGELTEEEIIVLAFFKKSEELNRLERYTILITPDNNHSGVIVALEEKGLIVKNPESPQLHPIFQVDRTLMKTDFSEELNNVFRREWGSLKKDYQNVLQAIYQHNQFGSKEKVVSANSIAKFLYLKEKKQISDIQDFGNFSRMVRNVFNKLEARAFIVRKSGQTKEAGGKADFKINDNYNPPQDLFAI